MQIVTTPNAPIPAGHYSQAVVHASLVFVAGQLPLDAERPGYVPDNIEEQTERALRNVEAILVASGSGLEHVLQMTVYLSDVSLWSRVNTVYARVMGAHKPARAIVPSGELHNGVLIEIQAIAATS